MDEKKSREEILAAIKAKAEAIRAQRAAAAARPEQQTAAPTGAAPTLDAFVSSLNAAGRPAAAPQNAQLQAFASVNYGVEITCAPTEEDNLRKILGGIGAYQNPLRGGAFQIDYRYYTEAKARLARAGYTVEEREFGPLHLGTWTPMRGGWSKVVDDKA